MTALLAPSAAAAALGIGERTLRKLVNAGAIAYVSVGAGRARLRRRFAREDIEAFIAARRQREETPAREVACPSSKGRARRTGTTNSSSGVVDFAARLERRRETLRRG
jgi:excisionase family DNA binding protein